jgi:hypothetical protein
MKLIKRSILQFTLFLFLFLPPVLSLAQLDGTITPCNISGRICNPIKENDLNGLIKTILEGLIKIGIPVVALAIIYCGFLFVKARGNTEQINKAKDALMYTLIGAAILLGSWAFAQLISRTVLAI